MLFLYKTCTLARWTLKTTFWVSISLTGSSNPKNITFPPPKRNLHGGPTGQGHPHWLQILPWKHTFWPLECTKTMLFLYKTCTLAIWTLKTTIWVSISRIEPSNPKKPHFSPSKTQPTRRSDWEAAPPVAPNPSGKRTRWPHGTAKPMLFLYKTCTLAR